MIKEGISLIITGDYCPNNRIQDLCLNKQYNKIYNDFLPILKETDIRISNLECPLTEHNIAIEKNGPYLKVHPDCINGIKFGGFDILTLANNHIYDYGREGLLDTIKICNENKILYVGAGISQKDASKPLFIKVKEITVAIVNFCENEFSASQTDQPGANSLNLVNNYFQITEAKKKADIVLVIIHGGHEMYSYPSPRMIQTYRFFAEIGASAVIGHHTHCISGYEVYKGIPVFYSLGNFIFDNEGMNNQWYTGMALKLFIKKNLSVSFEIIPFYQNKDIAGLKCIDDVNEKKEILNQIENISNAIQNEEKIAILYDQYIENNKYRYLFTIHNFGKVKKKLIKLFKFEKTFFKRKYLLKALNHIECESHKDLIIGVLRKQLNL